MALHKRILTLLLVITLLCAFPVMAFAHDVPDESRTGNIQISMQTANGTTVFGGSLTLYRVGEVFEDDGNYSFALTGDFVDCGQSLADLESTTLAKSLADYAVSRSLKGTTQNVDAKGTVSFKDVQLGLYLLVQEVPAEGYYKADPFLVSVPMMEDDVYIYDVDASPKVEVEHEPQPTNPPPTKPTKPTLPQTGQLNWPIPVLIVCGLVLLCVGWVLYFRKKNKNAQ